MEPPRGFEPRTYALRVRCSTPELRRRAPGGGGEWVIPSWKPSQASVWSPSCPVLPRVIPWQTVANLACSWETGAAREARSILGGAADSRRGTSLLVRRCCDGL
jgi:hypothetical protein